MRRAGEIVAATIDRVVAAVAPGVTTAALDRVAAATISEHGAEPSFLGYGGGRGRTPFPATICVSIGDEIVHGIPAEDRVLAEGDVVALDFGAIWEGFHADSAVTVFVGEPPSEDAARLVRETEAALAGGDRARRPRRSALGHRPRDRGQGRRRGPRPRARVRRSRHRPQDARGSVHPELGRRRPRARAPARPHDRGRTDAEPGRGRHRGARRRVDRGHGRRVPERPLRAHARRHRGRPRDPRPPGDER